MGPVLHKKYKTYIQIKYIPDFPHVCPLDISRALYFYHTGWPRHSTDTLTCRILTRCNTELIDTTDIDTP